MAYDHHIGDTATWKWGDGTASGTISERFTSRVERELGGSTVVRNASEDEPAYLIEQDDGTEVLKSCTELE